MQLQELTNLLQHPETITTVQADALLLKTNKYPYAQSLKALYLKGLKLKESYTYNTTLKRVAAQTIDRSVLFDYITSDVFNQNEISKQVKQNSETIKNIEINSLGDISINKSVIIDEALKLHIKATEGVLDPNLFKVKLVEKTTTDKKLNENYNAIDSETESQKQSISIKNNEPEPVLGIEKPQDFNKSEQHSFSEWLKIRSFNPIIREEEEEEEEKSVAAPLEDKLAIIDRFINENPKIKPVSNNHPKPRLVNNDTFSDSIMTETLARIYLEQKNYDNAIKAYTILSLKYPEKSSFFADQIKAVQKLKENNNL